MEILNSRQFREEIIKNLSLSISEDELAKKIIIGQVSNSNVISIGVQDINPQLASDIANQLTQIYITWTTENYQQNLKQVLGEINKKLEDSKQKLDNVSARILSLENFGNKVPESLRKELETNSELYVILSEKYENLRINETMGESSSIIIESAVPPSEPVKPNKKLIFISSIFIGLFGGGGIVLLRESLDNTIKTTDDIRKYYGLNIISQVTYDKAYNTKKKELIIVKDPGSQTSESLKELRTNLSYFNVDKKN